MVVSQASTAYLGELPSEQGILSDALFALLHKAPYQLIEMDFCVSYLVPLQLNPLAELLTPSPVSQASLWS